MSAITHDRAIKASCSTVYNALTTAEGLRSWFTEQVKGSGQQGSEWKMDFSHEPSFDWQIVSSIDNRSVSWKCLSGPGNSPGTEAVFHLKAAPNDHCILTISHNGWNKDDPKLDCCIEIWRNLMNHLQHYCETGIATPAYQ